MSIPSKPSKAASLAHEEASKIRSSNGLWKAKCGLALLTGIILGIIPVRGVYGFIIFVFVQCLVGQLYLASMKLPDYVLDQIEALTEHSITAFSVFIVSWVVSYSLYNY
ncbi:Rab5-interacting protein (Rab5ip) family protein [Babesia bovis T2Bo]|uniref:Rab5-interacting protein (Rab5ip) family protein n=1 Tax=Babesia bovis T2Bo TaxID=484906 RepID=UPI001C36800F|nr:Rab5-interacting protein (Rab5ip) family protein [Babesia bovis T2Bo]KAG6440039.1 Rab5-interacting protein (Rab5ip) family protein [Babesia bovis T2Bo]